MSKELKILVYGRVQGVHFRQFVLKCAKLKKITGYVENQENGSVMVVAQGSRKNLTEFLTQVQIGSFLSKITSLSYVWRELTEEYFEFIIKKDKPFLKDQKSSFLNLSKQFLKIDDVHARHVAVIPDGNRRWAKERGFSGSHGHTVAGSYNHIYSLVDMARNLGVTYLTFWLFSTENWKREKKEVEHLFEIITKFLHHFEKDALKNKICFRHIGRKDRIPPALLSLISEIEEKTKKFNDFHVQVALDYGGRDEVVRAINKLITSGVSYVTEEDLLGYLDTKGIPDVDLIIRTSGEYRTSGLLPVQGAYAEFYFTDLHFPDFGPNELTTALTEFSRRKRRFGGN